MCLYVCSPLHSLITPLPLSVCLPPAPYVSVSLPLSPVISIWYILAAVVGSVFIMWAGLISVLWWQMHWQSDLFLWNNESPQEPNTPGFVCHTCYHKIHSTLNNQRIFWCLAFVPHRRAQKHPHGPNCAWNVVETITLTFRTLAWAQPTYELQFEWWGHLMHMWVATCEGRLISHSPASGLLKGSGFGCLLHISHIKPPICLLTSDDTGT